MPDRMFHSPEGLPESPRDRSIRARGENTEGTSGLVAALIYIGDQISRLADELPEVLGRLDQIGRIADHLPGAFHEAFHHLDQAVAAATDIAHAVERLVPVPGEISRGTEQAASDSADMLHAVEQLAPEGKPQEDPHE